MKNVYIGLLFIALLIGCSWTFNHVNPWVGIIAAILIVSKGISLLINHLKNK